MRRGLLGVLTVILTLAFPLEVVAAPSPQPCCDRQVILVLMGDMSYEESLKRPWPFPRGGSLGIGLVTAADDMELPGLNAYEAIGAGGDERGGMQEALLQANLQTGLAARASLPHEVLVALLGSGRPVEGGEALVSSALIVSTGFSVKSPLNPFLVIGASPAAEILVVAASPVPSPAMRARGDEATPLVVARGDPDEFVPQEGTVCVPLSGCARGLSSDTTRREGIVSNVDVAPTILDFLGVPIPEEMSGSPIRIEGEPPTRLHQRYLQYQRIHTPVGLLALAIALVTLFVSVGLLVGWGGAPEGVSRALGALALISVALPVVMLPASLLPRLTYPVVLPTLAAGAAVVLIVALRWGRGNTVAPVAIVAGLGMGVVILDGVLGWPAMMMPLLGDSSLEGVRFYGMGNAYAGVYMAGAILLAARIPPVAGMLLLAASGLLVGLPGFGAELGTSFTLFVAAGLWYAIRVRRRFALREVAVAAAVALGGLLSILLIHRFSPIPTHVTRIVEDARNSGAGGFLAVFGRRLALNARNTSATPAAWLVVALLPVWFAVAWKRLGPFAGMLRRDSAWREATVVLALASMIGFLVNDTIGVAGLGFTYLSAALVFPALRERWTSV